MNNRENIEISLDLGVEVNRDLDGWLDNVVLECPHCGFRRRFHADVLENPRDRSGMLRAHAPNCHGSGAQHPFMGLIVGVDLWVEPGSDEPEPELIIERTARGAVEAKWVGDSN